MAENWSEEMKRYDELKDPANESIQNKCNTLYPNEALLI